MYTDMGFFYFITGLKKREKFVFCDAVTLTSVALLTPSPLSL